jgi:hypothetical protein
MSLLMSETFFIHPLRIRDVVDTTSHPALRVSPPEVVSRSSRFRKEDRIGGGCLRETWSMRLRKPVVVFVFMEDAVVGRSSSGSGQIAKEIKVLSNY